MWKEKRKGLSNKLPTLQLSGLKLSINNLSGTLRKKNAPSSNKEWEVEVPKESGARRRANTVSYLGVPSSDNEDLGEQRSPRTAIIQSHNLSPRNGFGGFGRGVHFGELCNYESEGFHSLLDAAIELQQKHIDSLCAYDGSKTSEEVLNALIELKAANTLGKSNRDIKTLCQLIFRALSEKNITEDRMDRKMAKDLALDTVFDFVWTGQINSLSNVKSPHFWRCLNRVMAREVKEIGQDSFMYQRMSNLLNKLTHGQDDDVELAELSFQIQSAFDNWQLENDRQLDYSRARKVIADQIASYCSKVNGSLAIKNLSNIHSFEFKETLVRCLVDVTESCTGDLYTNLYLLQFEVFYQLTKTSDLKILVRDIEVALQKAEREFEAKERAQLDYERASNVVGEQIIEYCNQQKGCLVTIEDINEGIVSLLSNFSSNVFRDILQDVKLYLKHLDNEAGLCDEINILENLSKQFDSKCVIQRNEDLYGFSELIGESLCKILSSKDQKKKTFFFNQVRDVVFECVLSYCRDRNALKNPE